MDGALRIRVSVLEGKTRVVESYARAPYHYLPLVQRDRELPLLTIVNSSGGILGGDALEARFFLDDRAEVTLRQQAATKVYRSTRGRARSVCNFVLGQGAWLDYFPDEIIPFAGSEYAQMTSVELGRNAVMLLGEIVTAGRLARGERFAFTRLILDLECADGDALLLRDRADIEPGRQQIDNAAILGNATLWGTFYLFTTRPLNAGLVDDVDEILAAADGMGGASSAPSGIVGRVLGTSLEAVRGALQRARIHVTDALMVRD